MMWYLMFVLYAPHNVEFTRITVGNFESADECLSSPFIADVPAGYTWKITCEEKE